MFRIGDFSKLSQVSVKTLRYYDEIGLLEPAEVDRFTGYRYYSAAQLPRLHRILALRDLGLSLEQIGQLIEGGLQAAELRGMLRLKQAELKQDVAEQEERLKRLDARLHQIEQEGVMSAYEVVIKKVPGQKVAAIRSTMPTYGDQGGLWGELEAYLGKNGARPSGPCLAVYYDTEYRERDVDVEVCEPIDANLPGTDRISVRVLPEVETMACALHRGAFETISAAYEALMTWVQVNGYQVCGPNREVYLTAMDTAASPEAYVTEVQFPVRKA